MALLRRKAPAAPQEEAAQPPLRRRIIQRTSAVDDILRRASSRTVAPAIATSATDHEALVKRTRAKIDEQLKLISNAELEIDNAQVKIEQAHKVIEAQLRLVNLTEHSDGVHTAALVDQWTRQSRTVDPQKFRVKVPNDVFWKCISVNLTKAQEHLGEKEINEISTLIPAVKQGIVLKVTRRKK